MPTYQARRWNAGLSAKPHPNHVLVRMNRYSNLRSHPAALHDNNVKQSEVTTTSLPTRNEEFYIEDEMTIFMVRVWTMTPWTLWIHVDSEVLLSVLCSRLKINSSKYIVTFCRGSQKYSGACYRHLRCPKTPLQAEQIKPRLFFPK